MLTTYPEIRDRIYQLARQRNLRIDWIESTPVNRTFLLYDSRQVVVARATVPLRRAGSRALALLEHNLEGIFGEGWMN